MVPGAYRRPPGRTAVGLRTSDPAAAIRLQTADLAFLYVVALGCRYRALHRIKFAFRPAQLFPLRTGIDRIDHHLARAEF